MSKALENRMALLAGQGAGLGFALVHLAFELMEDFLNVPAVLVEQHELIGGQGEWCKRCVATLPC